MMQIYVFTLNVKAIKNFLTIKNLKVKLTE